MKRLIAILTICLAFLTGSGDVLYWQVDENTTVDGGDIQEFLEPYPSSDDYFPAVRVKLIYGSSSKILSVRGYEDWPEYWGVEPMESPGGHGWGIGIPVPVQSQTGYNTISTVMDEFGNIVPDYPPDVLEALFIMELGYNEWNEGAEDYVWRTLAESAPELYKNLINDYMYREGDIRPNPINGWNPNFRTTVPEPSSALLCIIGFGVLMLRRKTSKWENG